MVQAAVKTHRLSIIIPVLNEAGQILPVLESLQALRNRGHELIVVDGGSLDETVSLSEPLADHVLTSRPGRAIQMQAGSSIASGELLWFLHADSRVPDHADKKIDQSLGDACADWGCFNVTIDDDHPLLKCVSWFMNQRSRLTGIATGDQGIFIRRTLYNRVGGFPPVPLMEDIRISTSLKRHGRPCRVRATLGTSSRRWKSRGVARTILTMWGLRLAHFAGASPERLARHYPVVNG